MYNEERLLPFFLDHYSFAEKIFLYDNRSDDKTRALASRCPKTVVRDHDTGGCCRELANVYLKNNAWKETSRGHADWVIVADADEFLYHPNLLEYLAGCMERGVTVPRPVGYGMTSASFPVPGRPITEQVRKGGRCPPFDKMAIFNPNKVDINYEPGCHLASPVGQVVFDDNPELKLLHMAFLGLEWVKWRWGRSDARRSPEDIEMGYSHHCAWIVQHADNLFAEALTNSFDII